MGLIEDLARARDAYERREWAASYEALCHQEPESLRGDDFARLATAALLLGRRNDAVQAMQRAYQVNVAAGQPATAAFCAFWLAMTLDQVGEDAVGSGWAARGERLLAGLEGEVVERGYLDFHRFLRAIHRGQFDEAARLAVVVTACGERFGEENLLVLGRSGHGRLMIMARPGGRGARAAGRGDGRPELGHGECGGGGTGLLHDDRGLPGDPRLRPGRAVDQ